MDSRVVAKFGEKWPLLSCQKVIWYWWQQNSISVRAPLLPHWADGAQNFLNVIFR